MGCRFCSEMPATVRHCEMDGRAPGAVWGPRRPGAPGAVSAAVPSSTPPPPCLVILVEYALRLPQKLAEMRRRLQRQVVPSAQKAPAGLWSLAIQHEASKAEASPIDRSVKRGELAERGPRKELRSSLCHPQTLEYAGSKKSTACQMGG